MKWSYGVTTCPMRRTELLPRTLASLAAGGFDKPHLFVDGDNHSSYWDGLKLEYTLRYPAVRTAGNWVLSLYELYYREPAADRYAIFQDDLLACKGLREYLSKSTTDEKCYWNCYAFQANERIAAGKVGWNESGEVKPGFQTGRGAVALVFSREGVKVLLSSPELAGRPEDCKRGHRSIDGGIVHAMNVAGWRERVHFPTLVQHMGDVSSMGNRGYPKPTSWRGEGWDAVELLM